MVEAKTGKKLFGFFFVFFFEVNPFLSVPVSALLKDQIDLRSSRIREKKKSVYFEKKKKFCF